LHTCPLPSLDCYLASLATPSPAQPWTLLGSAGSGVLTKCNYLLQRAESFQQSGLKADVSTPSFTPSFTVLEWIAGSVQSVFRVGTQALLFAGSRPRTQTCPRLRHRSRASPLCTNTTYMSMHVHIRMTWHGMHACKASQSVSQSASQSVSHITAHQSGATPHPRSSRNANRTVHRSAHRARARAWSRTGLTLCPEIQCGPL
jgi:hypothetical protein